MKWSDCCCGPCTGREIASHHYHHRSAIQRGISLQKPKVCRVTVQVNKIYSNLFQFLHREMINFKFSAENDRSNLNSMMRVRKCCLWSSHINNMGPSLWMHQWRQIATKSISYVTAIGTFGKWINSFGQFQVFIIKCFWGLEFIGQPLIHSVFQYSDMSSTYFKEIHIFISQIKKNRVCKNPLLSLH